MQQLNLPPEQLGLYHKMELILSNVPQKYLWQYSKIIFPVLKSTISLVSLLVNMVTYFEIQSKKGIQTTKILLQLLKKAKQINDQTLFKKMKELFETDFTSSFVQLMSFQKQKRLSKGLNYCSAIKYSKQNVNFSDNSFSYQRNGGILKDRQYLEANITNLTNNRIKQQKSLQFKNKTYTKIKDPFTQSSSAFDQSDCKISPNLNPISILDRIQQQNQLVQNCMQNEQNKCICGKIISESQQKQKHLVSNCQNCGNYYHQNCILIQKLGICGVCQIKSINPIHQIHKQLFMGVLHKNKKNHSVSFVIDHKVFNNPNIKIQIRCIRLKQKIQKQTLFPDSASIIVNNKLIKQFSPLHRQSSLKYRKDQPVILQNLSTNNNLIISERFQSKDRKDQRIQIEEHLIGIFAVEQLTVNKLMQFVQNNCQMNFSQSKDVLKSTFQLSTHSIGQQQLTCDIVKIPLTCILSTECIRIPVRGKFCTHFQCFDLQNYILMTVNSSYSRWVCPLCKKPTGELVEDYILKQILDLDIKNATEVMFHKSGEFIVMFKQQQLKLPIKNIDSFEQIEKQIRKFSEEKKRILQKQCDQTIEQVIYKPFCIKREEYQNKNQVAIQHSGMKRTYPQYSDYEDEKTKKKIKFVMPIDVSVIELD